VNPWTCIPCKDAGRSRERAKEYRHPYVNGISLN
jgi:hypothetical protein